MNSKLKRVRWFGHGWRRLTISVLVALAGLPVVAQTTNNQSRLDYSAFRIIADRNIFNTRRYARTPGQADRRDSRRSRVESLALVGTMIYDKGPLAFFDGSRSDYRKVLKPADSIAGFQVVEIAPDDVKLAAGTNEFQLRVGRQLQREEEGPWKVAERQELPMVAYSPPTSVRSTAAPAASPEASAPPPEGEPQVMILDGSAVGLLPLPEGGGTNTAPESAAGGSESDILRRLMQRREQEMN